MVEPQKPLHYDRGTNFFGSRWREDDFDDLMEGVVDKLNNLPDDQAGLDVAVSELLDQPTSSLTTKLTNTFVRQSDIPWPDGLVGFWDFSESTAPYYSKAGMNVQPLTVGGTAPVPSATPGPFGTGITFNGVSDYLKIPAAEVGPLNVARVGDEVTVVAWFRRGAVDQNNFVAGMWQENVVDHRRQYGLFVDLPLYGGNDSVCMHASRYGGASPGLPYSRDYSSSGRRIIAASDTTYRMIAGTYDGRRIVSYLDGVSDIRTSYTEPSAPSGAGLTYDKNPYLFDLGLNRSTAPSDFTVGAVLLTSGMGNWLRGDLGGVAVFNRALTPAEIMRVHLATVATGPLIRLGGDKVGGFSAGSNQGATVFGLTSVKGATALDVSKAFQDLTKQSFSFVYLGGSPVFMFRGYHVDNNNHTTNGFVFTDTIRGLRLSQLKAIEFDMNNNNLGDTVRVCLRVGEQWVASSTGYAVTTKATAGSDWSTAESFSAEVSKAAAGWCDLTCVPGSTLSLSAEPRTADLPNDEVTGIGFYSPPLVSTTSLVRIANVRVFGF